MDFPEKYGYSDYFKWYQKINDIILNKEKDAFLNLIETGEINDFIEYGLDIIRSEKIKYLNFITSWSFIQRLENLIKNNEIKDFILNKENIDELYYRKAILLLEYRKDIKRAKKVFESLLKTNFANRSRYYLSIINLKSGNIQEAKRYFQELKTAFTQNLDNIHENIEEFFTLRQMIEDLILEFNLLEDNQNYYLITSEDVIKIELIDESFIDSLKSKYSLFVDFENEEIFINSVRYEKQIDSSKLKILLCMAFPSEICRQKNIVRLLEKKEGVFQNSIYKRIKRLKDELKHYGIKFRGFKIESSFCFLLSKNSLDNFIREI